MPGKERSEAGPGRPRCAATDRAILEATLRQLAAVGYARMSMDAVAADAGTTKPTIYRRWPNKEALAVAAVAHLQRSDGPEPTGALRPDLAAILDDFRRKLLRPNGMAMVGAVLAEEAHVPELIARFREQVVAPRRERLLAVLRAGVDDGSIAPGADLDAAANALIGAFYARYMTGQGVPDDWPARVVDTLLDGLSPR